MLDLKNCPFCGGKATFAKTTKGWKVECEGRWGTCTINARTHYQPTKGQAVDAWNRRALQAVGPEPAVAVKPLIWTEDRDDDGTEIHRARGGEVNLPYTIYEDGFIKKPFGLSLNQLRIGSFDTVEAAKAAAEADYASRIRSALVATPPAERVVEAPQPANSVRGAAERVVSFDWSSNDPDAVAAVDALRAALAAKPAVKDDETVVEAARAVLADWDARLPDGPEVHRTNHDLDFSYWSPNAAMISAEVMSKLRAALAAKDGRS